jgi:hypothetical protein
MHTKFLTCIQNFKTAIQHMMNCEMFVVKTATVWNLYIVRIYTT